MLGIGGIIAAGLAAVTAAADGPVMLQERAKSGGITRVVIGLKAEGTYRVSGAEKTKAAPQPLKVEGRFEAWERVVGVGSDGQANKVVRRARQAAAAVNSEPNPFVTSLRPEVAVLVAERREGQPFAFSPSGPLTRAELEVIQWPGDPLVLPLLLPTKPVAAGDTWEVGGDAARGLSGYDALASNELKATLTKLDDDAATLTLAGTVRGAILGAEGTMTFDGSCTFDRKAGRIARLDLTRQETRKPGQVEQGLEVKSTLTVERTDAEAPPELADAAVGRLVGSIDPALEQIRYTPPRGTYAMIHDRAWHIAYDDERQAVLKRLDHGELVAQCNLAIGPNAGKGRHQDPKQFEDDLRRALGKRLDKVLFAGKLDDESDGLFRYRVAALGHNDDGVGILWIYYLVANPDGEQLLATFTLAQSAADRFADEDLRMIGSLAWPAAGEKK